MKTPPTKGSAIELMAKALLGVALAIPGMVWMCEVAMSHSGWLGQVPVAWLVLPFALLALVWLWFHRSPDNTHFVHILSKPVEKKGSAFLLMAGAVLVVVFLGGPVVFVIATRAGMDPTMAALVAGLAVIVTPIWLWFHRSPDNTHFTRIFR